MSNILTSDDILCEYRKVETQRIAIADKIEQYGDKFICEYDILTDRLDELDLKYQRMRNIEKCLASNSQG